MHELHSPERAFDEILLAQGPHHQEKFQIIADGLKERFNEPDLFNPNIQKQLDEWVAENGKEIFTFITRTLCGIKRIEND